MIIKLYDSYEQMVADNQPESSAPYATTKAVFKQVIKYFNLEGSNELNLNRREITQIINNKNVFYFQEVFSPLFLRIGSLFTEAQSRFILNNLTDTQWEFVPANFLLSLDKALLKEKIKEIEHRDISMHRMIFDFKDKDDVKVIGIVSEKFPDFLEKIKKDIENAPQKNDGSPFARDYSKLFKKKEWPLEDVVNYLALSKTTMRNVFNASLDNLPDSLEVYRKLRRADPGRTKMIPTSVVKEILDDYYVDNGHPKKSGYPKEGLFTTSQVSSLYGQVNYVFQFAVRQGNINYYKFGEKCLRFSIHDVNLFIGRMVDNTRGRRVKEFNDSVKYVDDKSFYFPLKDVVRPFANTLRVENGKEVFSNSNVVDFFRMHLPQYKSRESERQDGRGIIYYVKKQDLDNLIKNRYGYWKNDSLIQPVPLSLNEFMHSEFVRINSLLYEVERKGNIEEEPQNIYRLFTGDNPKISLPSFIIETRAVYNPRAVVNSLIYKISQKLQDKSLSTKQVKELKQLNKEAMSFFKKISTSDVLRNTFWVRNSLEKFAARAEKLGIHIKIVFETARYVRKKDLIDKLKEEGFWRN